MTQTTIADVRTNPKKPKVYKNRHIATPIVKLTHKIANEMWNGKYKNLKTRTNSGIGYLVKDVSITTSSSSSSTTTTTTHEVGATGEVTLSGTMYGPWVNT